MLKPFRQKTIEGHINQPDFVDIPKEFENHIFISKTKACFLGRKPSASKVMGGFKAVPPEAWQSVSALHAILRWKDGTVTIEDRSSNGTWVGKPGKGSGQGEEDYRRLAKNIEEEVAMDSYIMLAQWPNNRKAEDVLMCVLMLHLPFQDLQSVAVKVLCVEQLVSGLIPLTPCRYKLVAIPPEASSVHEAKVQTTTSIPQSTPPINGGSALVSKPIVTAPEKMEPCKMCKAQTEETLKAKAALMEERSKVESQKLQVETMRRVRTVLPVVPRVAQQILVLANYCGCRVAVAVGENVLSGSHESVCGCCWCSLIVAIWVYTSLAIVGPCSCTSCICISCDMNAAHLSICSTLCKCVGMPIVQ
jgi:hypothetical protein